MDAGSVLVDKTLYSKRSNSSVPGLRGGSFNSNTLPGRRFSRIHGGDAGYSGLYPSPYIAPCARPPPPVYSSLPTQQAHPALLPLPVSVSLSLPSLIPLPQKTKVVARSAPYSAGKDQKKQGYSPVNAKKDLQRGLTRPQKVPQAATPNARVLRPTSAAISFCKGQKPEAVDEGDKADYVYVLSPPPSSLPMPSFCLRARTPPPPPPRAASCNLNAFGGGGALLPGAGASGDLRRILRL